MKYQTNPAIQPSARRLDWARRRMKGKWALFVFISTMMFFSGCDNRRLTSRSECRVVAFGDSLTAGIGESEGKPYTTFLDRDMRAAGHPCTVVNEGVSGQTAAVALSRVDQIIALHPSLVIVELGGNDALQGREAAQIEADLDVIVQALLRAHVRVVLAGVRLPTGFDPAYAGRFQSVYSRVAERNHLASAISMVEGLDLPGMLQEDGIHPTVEGNKRLAKNVEPAVLEALKSNN
jgi:acyl-CoA thioesterase I